MSGDFSVSLEPLVVDSAKFAVTVFGDSIVVGWPAYVLSLGGSTPVPSSDLVAPGFDAVSTAAVSGLFSIALAASLDVFGTSLETSAGALPSPEGGGGGWTLGS